MAQCQSIADILKKLHPKVALRIVPMESEADRFVDRPLASVGGKGLFARSIEQALLRRQADIAVHSLKDLPTESTHGLVIAAVTARADPRDVLVSRSGNTIETLPQGARVGTSSPRRAAQLSRLRRDVHITLLRGNVDTRIAKVLEGGELDATLLAAAGLIRLQHHDLARHTVPIEQILPAAGQGALAIQVRVDDHISLRRCMMLNDAATSLAVNAERRVVAELGADCHSPVAVYCDLPSVDRLHIRARVLAADGSACLEAEESGPVKKDRKLCKVVARSLITQGAKQLLSDAAKAA